MDLIDEKTFRLDDPKWPLLSRSSQKGPARVLREATMDGGLLSPGCRVAGHVTRSVLAPGVVVEAGASVENAVLLEDVVIKAGSRVINAVLDKGVVVEEGARVGGEGEPTLVGMDVRLEAGSALSAGERRNAEANDPRS